MPDTLSTHRPPVLLLINGAPGTGKTTLSQMLRTQLQLPLIHRDTIKELMFDCLGWHDRQWSKKIGITSYKVLYYLLEQFLQTQHSVIVESNFDPAYDGPQMAHLQATYGYTLVQILCTTDPAILVKRLHGRRTSGERHPGHADHEELASLTPTDITGSLPPLPVNGPVIYVDTTDTQRIEMASLIAQLKVWINP